MVDPGGLRKVISWETRGNRQYEHEKGLENHVLISWLAFAFPTAAKYGLVEYTRSHPNDAITPSVLPEAIGLRPFDIVRHWHTSLVLVSEVPNALAVDDTVSNSPYNGSTGEESCLPSKSCPGITMDPVHMATFRLFPWQLCQKPQIFPGLSTDLMIPRFGLHVYLA